MKTEHPNTFFAAQELRRLVAVQMAYARMDNYMLADELRHRFGLDISRGTLAQRLRRGSYSAAFLVMLMDCLAARLVADNDLAKHPPLGRRREEPDQTSLGSKL